MGRLNHVLNVLVVLIGAIVAWNERRDPARREDTALGEQAGGASPASPAIAGQPAGSADEPTDSAPAVPEAVTIEATTVGDDDGLATARADDQGSTAEPAFDILPDLAARQEVAAEARFSPTLPTAVGDDAADAPVIAPAADASSADATTVPPFPPAPGGPGATTPTRSGAANPPGAVAGDGTATCPADFPIKGNASSMIFHQPGQSSYERTIAEFCFASEEAAVAAGYRPPRR